VQSITKIPDQPRTRPAFACFPCPGFVGNVCRASRRCGWWWCKQQVIQSGLFSSLRTFVSPEETHAYVGYFHGDIYIKQSNVTVQNICRYAGSLSRLEYPPSLPDKKIFTRALCTYLDTASIHHHACPPPFIPANNNMTKKTTDHRVT
jgi:hypothetical protein